MSGFPWLWPDSTVTRVIDGDSLVVRVTRDIGFHGTVTFDQKVRLNRINTPPGKTAEGITAAARTADLVMGVLVNGQSLLVETVKPYKYGDEFMAEITLPDGRNVSDVLVSEGLAQYWDGTGPRPGG